MASFKGFLDMENVANLQENCGNNTIKTTIHALDHKQIITQKSSLISLGTIVSLHITHLHVMSGNTSRWVV